MKLDNSLFFAIKNTKGEPDIGSSFVSDLNETIKQENSSTYKPSKTYKPSSMHCIRNMFYQVSGHDVDIIEDTPANVSGICESGTDRHVRVQNYIMLMKKHGFDCEYVDVETYVKQNNLYYLKVLGKKETETKLHDIRYNITFLCDGIVKYKGKYYIFEFKTETAEKFQMRFGVDKEHYNQATAYSLALKLDDVIFVYENRNICEKQGFYFNVTQEMRDALAKKLITCDEFVKSNTVPPKPTDLAPKHCKYCKYKISCSKESVDSEE